MVSIQPWQIAELSLADLVRRGQTIEQGECCTALRLAVLGDCATQHYVSCLAAALKLRGVWPHVYEAEYDGIQQQTIVRDSALYAHAADAVIFFNCLQKLEEAFFKSTQRAHFVDGFVAETVGNWRRVLASGAATVVQHNVCLPILREFGNFSAVREESFVRSVARINDELARHAHENGAVRIIDTESQAALFGKREWLDERFWCQAKQALSPRFLPPLVKSVSDVLLERMGRSVKCVILDLDNTLWGGILGDVGYDGIEIGEISSLGRAFQRFQAGLLALKSRGIILAIASKNDHANVLEVLTKHPDMVLKASDFVKVAVDYNDKVTNIRAIQAALDISFDSMVFLDDSPFERDFVRTALPDVQVPDLPEDPAEFLSALARWNLFEVGTVSQEDRLRTAFYQANVQRQEQQAQATDLASYLRDLNMEADIRPFDTFTTPRALQLFQRSNQFNLTTIRYSSAELAVLAKTLECDTFTIALHDRLGDNGIVSAVITRTKGRALHVDSWVMSCRVLGRGVEDLTLDILVDLAHRRGCDRIVGEYRPTGKNKLVADLYHRLGFVFEREDGRGKFYSLEVARYRRPVDLPIVAKVRQHDEV